ncbi:Nudix hydrolase domain-containing protein [Forsythia ovata]|uniref:Nudix hydrolase domain-containing protein n=1 Tax=Forsythia ovata TaxID=205694 RepID=A0ABD1R496_9LAMI
MELLADPVGSVRRSRRRERRVGWGCGGGGGVVRRLVGSTFGGFNRGHGGGGCPALSALAGFHVWWIRPFGRSPADLGEWVGWASSKKLASSDLQAFFEKIKLCSCKSEMQCVFIPFVLEKRIVGYVHNRFADHLRGFEDVGCWQMGLLADPVECAADGRAFLWWFLSFVPWWIGRDGEETKRWRDEMAKSAPAMGVVVA